METTGSKFDVTGVTSAPRVIPDAAFSSSDRAQVSESKAVSPTTDVVEVAAPTVEEEKKTQSEAKELREELSFDEARKMAQNLEKALNSSRETVVKFRVSLVNHQQTETNPFQFQVVDRETGEIVRQFPPEDILGQAHRMKGDLAGLVVDQSA